MAQTFNLQCDGTTINLINTAGWHILDPGWVPKIALADEPVQEAVRIFSNFATQDALATALIALNNMRRDAARYLRDRTEAHPVWLYDQLVSETNQRRAAVRHMALKQLTEAHGTGPMGDMIGAQPYYSLAIERQPYWESASDQNATTTNLSALGGSLALSGLDGDAPGRLYSLKIASSLARTFKAGWFGFRSANKHGTLANFVPLWELEGGTAGTDTALAADATASPGGGGNTKQTCTFAGVAGWGTSAQYRVSINLSTGIGGANYEDNYGRFVVLLRAKVTAGEAWVRLGHMYGGATSIALGRIVEVDATAWTIYNMGTVTIPLRDLQAMPLALLSATHDQYQYIRIYAREETTCDLDLDCLVLIPADEYYIHVEDMWTIGAGTDRSTYIGVSPLGRHYGFGVDTVADTGMTACRIDTAGDSDGVPIGDIRLYGVVAAANNDHDLSDDWDPTLNVLPRWYSLRGAE